MSTVTQPTDTVHPDRVDGWDGSMQELVRAIGKMRYDRVAVFIALFDEELRRQASGDRDAGRTKLATHLDRAAVRLGLAKNEIDQAWAISAPFEQRGIQEAP